MKVIATAVVLFVPLAGCGSSHSGGEPGPRQEAVGSGQTVSGTGTVSWREVEGGFYVIESDDGPTYDPIDLPPRYREDGLRVHFEARLRTDLMSTHMVGTLIELTGIRELDAPGPAGQSGRPTAVPPAVPTRR